METKLKIWSVKKVFKSVIEAELFMPGLVGVFTNPFFITRKTLYSAIACHSKFVNGETLDFGCGSKPYEKLFINSTQYIGCDIEVSGHDHRTSKIDVFYDGSSLPFEGNSFDSVVSFETLEHVFNVNKILSELNRVLKPNGTILVTVPFVWEEHEVPFDYARYSTYGLKHILESHGFKVLSMERLGTNVDVIAQLFMVSLLGNVKSGKIRLILTAIVQPIVLILSRVGRIILPGSGGLFLNSICVAQKVAQN